MKYKALHNELLELLSHYCGEHGDSEGATETLKRLFSKA